MILSFVTFNSFFQNFILCITHWLTDLVLRERLKQSEGMIGAKLSTTPMTTSWQSEGREDKVVPEDVTEFLWIQGRVVHCLFGIFWSQVYESWARITWCLSSTPAFFAESIACEAMRIVQAQARVQSIKKGVHEHDHTVEGLMILWSRCHRFRMPRPAHHPHSKGRAGGW